MDINLAAILATATAAVHEGAARLKEAEDALREAERARATARDYLNTAQVDFDKAVAEVRAKAPRGSEWDDDRGERVNG